jgi:hypothetical protein
MRRSYSCLEARLVGWSSAYFTCKWNGLVGWLEFQRYTCSGRSIMYKIHSIGTLNYLE